ncbi:hypothetical protein QCA50_017862 [Cerrena zonata]|uniref:60S ribosomal protein L31 n=1 Tax=Cerrena zonata TaxID=2478898 RepID=A0AAW0FC68_9APHY
MLMKVWCPTSNFLHGVHFKKRAPKAVKEIKKFATLHMGTTDVRLDPRLNVQLWSRGVQGVSTRLRLRISRKRNDEEDAKEKLFAFVEPVNVPSAKVLIKEVDEDQSSPDEDNEDFESDEEDYDENEVDLSDYLASSMKLDLVSESSKPNFEFNIKPLPSKITIDGLPPSVASEDF